MTSVFLSGDDFNLILIIANFEGLRPRIFYFLNPLSRLRGVKRGGGRKDFMNVKVWVTG